MKRLSQAQELMALRREQEAVRRKPYAWQIAYDTMPGHWKDKHMVDSSMTMEQINARARQYIEDSIPYEWREAICTCVGPNIYGADGNVLDHCKKCGKIGRHRFFTCAGCKQKYIAGDFEHHLLAVKTHDNMVLGNFGHRFWRVDEDTTVRLSSHCFNCLSRFCSEDSDVPPPDRTVEVRSIDEILTLDLDEDIPVFKL